MKNEAAELEDFFEEYLEDVSDHESKPPQRAGKRRFDPKMATLMKEFDAQLRTRVAEVKRKILMETGSKFDGLDAYVNLRVGVKGPPGSAAVYNSIIDKILTPSLAVGTQTAIRNAVVQQFPTFSVPKDWSKPLPKWAVRRIEKRLRSVGYPFLHVKVSRSETLASLHRQASASVKRSETGSVLYSAAIEVMADRVLVNGQSFKLSTTRSAKKAEYQYVRLPIGKLTDALQSGNRGP